jgi:hypothetical protein
MTYLGDASGQLSLDQLRYHGLLPANPTRQDTTMTAKKKTAFKPNRLQAAPKIKPLPEGKQLAPYQVPAPPPGKFSAVPGQLTLEDMGCIETAGGDDQDAA